MLQALLSIVANFYGVKPRSLQRQYKDYLSDFKQWEQNHILQIGYCFHRINETAFSNGDLYTILTNKKAKGKKGALLAMIKVF